MIHLLSRYDPILKSLLEERTKNSITYLRPAMQNEIIDMIGNSIREKIIFDVRQSPFFSVILDSTQDIAKIDQLSTVLRYVTIEKQHDKPKEIIIHESFLGFIPIKKIKLARISVK